VANKHFEWRIVYREATGFGDRQPLIFATQLHQTRINANYAYVEFYVYFAYFFASRSARATV